MRFRFSCFFFLISALSCSRLCGAGEPWSNASALSEVESYLTTLEYKELPKWPSSSSSKSKKNGFKFIEEALRNLHPKSLKEALARNYFGQASNQTLLTLAIVEDFEPLVTVILDNYSGLSREKATFDGSLPLHIAAGKGDLDTVERLLQLGSDPNSTNLHDATPLHYAAVTGRGILAHVLIKAGGDPAARDENKLTPLHIATGAGNLDFARNLFTPKLSKAACYQLLKAEDSDGHTPLQIAKLEGRSDFVEWLEEKYSECNVYLPLKEKKTKPSSSRVRNAFLEDFDEKAVGISYFEGMGRGLVALKDILKGALVAKYPLDLIDFEEQGTERSKIVTISDYAFARPAVVEKFIAQAETDEGVDTEYAFECKYQGRVGLAFPLNPKNGREVDAPQYIAHLVNDGASLEFPADIPWKRFNESNLKKSVFDFLDAVSKNINIRLDVNLIIEDGQPFIRMYAGRTIKKGEQIFLFYGHDYWARHFCKANGLNDQQSEKIMELYHSLEDSWLEENARKGNAHPFWWDEE